MKIKTLTTILFAAVAIQAAAAMPQRDTLYISEFGLAHSTGENATPAIKRALEACREQGASVLAFDCGRYDIQPEGAEQREWFISNTSTEKECPSKVKTIGILVEEMHDLTIDGRGADLVFHGKMITIAVARSRNIVLKNLSVDFERPGMSEMVVTGQDEQGTTVEFHPDSRYKIDSDGHISLVGEGWTAKYFHCIDFDPGNDHLNYSHAWDTLRSSKAIEIAPRKVRFATPDEFRAPVGHTLGVRDIIRDHVGLFLYESRDVELRDVRLHYMHGLGVVSQFTRNISMHNVICKPREGSGRIFASSADFMHFSGCSGRISILDCLFDGAQDDHINVHGTNLRIIGKRSGNRLRLRFMHGQSYGFSAFAPQDSVAFVTAATMQRTSYAVVNDVKRISNRVVEVTLDREIPQGVVIGHDCLENMTCTPEVEIRRCRFMHTNTRGTLMTTPRRVVIADNTYIKTGMSAILIEGDASGWFESGPVCDVLIENNTFIDCGYTGGPANAVIALHPSNTVIDPERPVHRNVRILNNRFETFGNPALYAKSSADVRFEGNEVSVNHPDLRAPRKPRAYDHADRRFTGKPFILVGCKDVTLEGNRIEGYDR